jgi:hypothetical protein
MFLAYIPRRYAVFAIVAVSFFGFWSLNPHRSLAATAVGKPVHFSTCTKAGVEQNCVIARADDGASYNVTGAVSGLKPNQWLQGTGTVSDRMSLCMQGSPIEKFTPDRKPTPSACGR